MSKVLIVEDDLIISEVLREIVTSEGYKVTGVCADEKSALESVRYQRPDFGLLDIKLLGDDLGTNVAKHLKELKIPFAFITSYADKNTIQEAVALGPKGYLLKPFDRNEVIELLERLISSKKETITIKSLGVNYIVDLADIIYVQSDNVYVEVFTTKKKYLVRQKMSDFLSFVSPSQFIRTHRSFAVNKDYIIGASRHEILLENEKIPVSKKYSENVVNLLE